MKFFIHKTCSFGQAGTQRMNESRMISGYGSSSFFYWYVSSHTSIKYQSLFDLSKRNASSDLQVLVENGIIEKTGTTGKGTSYSLRGDIGAKGAI